MMQKKNSWCGCCKVGKYSSSMGEEGTSLIIKIEAPAFVSELFANMEERVNECI